MNEILRLQYLNALGVDQWVANSPLVNARASQFFSVERHDGNSLLLESHEETHVNLLKEKQLNQQTPIEKQTKKFDEKTSETAVSYHLQLQGKQGAYVCIIEFPKSGILDNEAQKLLENIMKAVDQLITSQKTAYMRPEVFKWPMFQQQSVVSHIDQGQSAAREALNAFLFSFMKRNRQTSLFVFGENILSLLDKSACDKNSVRLISAPGLTDLMNNPVLKKGLWQEILKQLG